MLSSHLFLSSLPKPVPWQHIAGRGSELRVLTSLSRPCKPSLSSHSSLLASKSKDRGVFGIQCLSVKGLLLLSLTIMVPCCTDVQVVHPNPWASQHAVADDFWMMTLEILMVSACVRLKYSKKLFLARTRSKDFCPLANHVSCSHLLLCWSVVEQRREAEACSEVYLLSWAFLKVIYSLQSLEAVKGKDQTPSTSLATKGVAVRQCI